MGPRALILLDTQALVWISLDPGQLGHRAHEKAHAAWLVDELHVSAMTFWEAGMLVRKGRLTLSVSPSAWRLDLLGAGIREIPLDGEMACLAEDLTDFHGDLGDRLIVATALVAGLALLTADQLVLRWSGELPRIDARR